jgi:hypothetical protein
VRLEAVVNPQVSNALVHFTVFDVDDPWTNAAPIDADPNAADNHAEVSLTIAAAMTDVSGLATNIFTVSKKPGNNYRVLASCDLLSATAAQALNDETRQNQRLHRVDGPHQAASA